MPTATGMSADRQREGALLRLSTGIAAAESEQAICRAVVDGLHDPSLGFDFVAVLLVEIGRAHV